MLGEEFLCSGAQPLKANTASNPCTPRKGGKLYSVLCHTDGFLALSCPHRSTTAAGYLARHRPVAGASAPCPTQPVQLGKSSLPLMTIAIASRLQADCY